ncbi:MAG: hypothetical protein IJV62_03230 [Eggerthellaceae bacterium]|nr:hypothetical protein [Eggerthellaceae bacterium]
MACWDRRGCDEEMLSRCPHSVGNDYCPAECKFATCDLPSHRQAVGLQILDNPDVDRNAAIKEQCRTCLFFIQHGPKLVSHI